VFINDLFLVPYNLSYTPLKFVTLLLNMVSSYTQMLMIHIYTSNSCQRHC